MKRAILTGLLAGLLVTCTACGTTTAASTTLPTATSQYTASFKVAQTALPGDESSPNLPTSNTWGFDSYVFMEVSIPTFDAGEVELDEPMEGEQIPVLTFTPNPGWTRIEEKTEAGVWHTVWFYSFPVASGAGFPPLFDEWTLTNFRIRNGVCGEHTYDEIIAAANRALVTRYSLQAVMDGTPETLWGMVN